MTEHNVDPADPTALAERVGELEWYHTIELPGGVVTSGKFDHRRVLHRYGLPPDLRGLRVLDAGTFDGLFAFELERRGAAEVVAIDLPDRDSLDWPAPLRRQDPPGFRPRRVNFDLAKSALSSSVRHELVSVYEVSEQRLGRFDYIFVGSLLVHLRNPLGALAALHGICDDRIHVVEPTHRGLDWISFGLASAKFQAISPHLTWWIPNRRCLRDWLEAAGFVDVRLGDTFVVPFGGRPGGIRHTVVTGCSS